MKNTPNNNTLSIKDVTIAYDKTDVVFNANFEVKQGEMFGLVGLNGAGKTTLIKSILGLRAIRQGDLAIFGHNVKQEQARKNIVYLPERFEPPWFLTGMEFIQFSLDLYKRKVNKTQVYEAAEKLALDPKALDRKVQTYSKGMRQKLGLIGTVLTECSFVILDEPMSGLDPLARTLVKDMLMDVKSKDQTIFMCSHILADLDEMCNRIAVIHKGHVIFVDSPKKLKEETNSENLERAFLSYIQDLGQQKAA